MYIDITKYVMSDVVCSVMMGVGVLKYIHYIYLWYICMHVCVYIDIYVYGYASAYAYIYIYINIYAYI